MGVGREADDDTSATVSTGEPQDFLNTLPDDALRLVFLCLRKRSTAWWEIEAFFAICRRMRQLVSALVDELELTSAHSPQRGLLTLPYGKAGHRVNRMVTMVAPFAWGSRFSGLRALELTHLSWSGAARLVTLLRAWPQLEQVELRFEYDYRSATAMRSMVVRGQEFIDDLATALSAGSLPRLRYLWLGSLDSLHCFGQRFAGGTIAQRCQLMVDDGALLEQLKPTAAVWWMAERSTHVRCSALHKFQYEIEHGADVRGSVASLTLLEWMRVRLAEQKHSATGARAVRALFLRHGATAADDKGTGFIPNITPAAVASVEAAAAAAAAAAEAVVFGEDEGSLYSTDGADWDSTDGYSEGDLDHDVHDDALGGPDHDGLWANAHDDAIGGPDHDGLWANHAVAVLDLEADEGGLDSGDGQLMEEVPAQVPAAPIGYYGTHGQGAVDQEDEDESDG